MWRQSFNKVWIERWMLNLFFYFVLGKEVRHPITSEFIDPDPDRKFAYVFLVKLNKMITTFDLFLFF